MKNCLEDLWTNPTALERLAERAWGRMRELHARDRWSGFSGYRESSAYCADALREVGAAKVERVAFPADGETLVADWRMPLAWDAEAATLSLAGPGLPRMADYRQCPQSLVMWSAPTPPGGVEGDLLVLEHGTPEEVAQLDVRGRIVFTPRHPTEIKAAVARGGGLGIVSDWLRARDLPEARQWINTWSDAPGGWAMHASDARLWGFMLSPEQGRQLRQEATSRSTPLRLCAQVNTRLYPGELHWVTGVLPGETDEELLLMAHINEQGANDNAAGAATTLEVARFLHQRWASGARPRRTVRFLLMPESYGTIAYAVRERERLGRTLVAFNLDSGAGSYDHEDSVLELFANPHCCPNYADAILAGIAQEYYERQERPDKWRLKRYNLAGDNFFCEPLIGVPHPWVMMGDGGDLWHNTADTPDRVDPRSLRDLAAVVSAFIALMAEASPEEIRASARAARARLSDEDQRLLHFPDDPEPTLELPAAGRELFPRRSTIGALTLDRLPPDQWGPVSTSPRWWGPLLAAWWWADGSRSLAEIAARVAREFGKPPDNLGEFFDWLREVGYVEISLGGRGNVRSPLR